MTYVTVKAKNIAKAAVINTAQHGQAVTGEKAGW